MGLSVRFNIELVDCWIAEAVDTNPKPISSRTKRIVPALLIIGLFCFSLR